MATACVLSLNRQCFRSPGYAERDLHRRILFYRLDCVLRQAAARLFIISGGDMTEAGAWDTPH